MASSNQFGSDEDGYPIDAVVVKSTPQQLCPALHQDMHQAAVCQSLQRGLQIKLPIGTNGNGDHLAAGISKTLTLLTGTGFRNENAGTPG